MKNQRAIVSLSLIIGFVVLSQFGQDFFNALAAFLLAGIITGTDLTLPSLVMLFCTLLALVGTAFWSFHNLGRPHSRTRYGTSDSVDSVRARL